MSAIEEAFAVAIIQDEEENSSCSSREFGIHPLWRSRDEKGEFEILCKDLWTYSDKFYDYFHMTQDSFGAIHDKIKDCLEKKTTRFRKPISTQQRLALCLRFLTTGDSFKTLSLNFRMGHSTVCKIVNETCRAIVLCLLKEVMPQPNEEMWRTIAHEFERLWRFPNCIGAIDGKHFCIEAPANSGSVYFNYKKTFSIVLLALVDAHYKFTYVDVGSYGRNSDGSIFANSSLGQGLNNNTLNIPPGRLLPNSNITTPFVMVGDEAFPLKPYLMRPYPRDQANGNDPETNYNLKLSLARRLVENAFGLLTQKFRIFSRRMKSAPKNVDYIILCTCVLHNFLRERNDMAYVTVTHAHDSPDQRPNLHTLSGPVDETTNDGFAIRELFKNYFESQRLQTS